METSLDQKYFILSNGQKLPKVGLGTYRMTDYEPILTALKQGYRHIDTAARYKNEHLIGQAITEALNQGILNKRDEVFITTKIWYEEYDDVENACRSALDRLQTSYIDLYLIHWPAGFFCKNKKPMHVLWAEMEALVDKGLVRGIGVSNCNT